MPADELPKRSVSQLAGLDRGVFGFSGDALKKLPMEGRRSKMLTFYCVRMIAGKKISIMQIYNLNSKKANIMNT